MNSMKTTRRPGLIILTALSLLACLTRHVAAQRQNAAVANNMNQRIAHIENFRPIPLETNEPPIHLNLEELMKIYNVPGLSVAVFNNYKLDWAKGYGVAKEGTANPVTPHTLFPACSISKPISAMAALHLVQEGKLSLDEDVNLKLKSWKVPENQYTARQKVTLRRILTHTAGTTVHGFPGYEAGQPIPTLVQMLNGEKPANNEPVRVDYLPGTKQRYSGGGFLILQQLMIDVTGEPFPQLMKKIVIDPLGLKDSTFAQPLPTPRTAEAAHGHNKHGGEVTGGWNVSPEMAVGGLWTTPSDLGKMALEVALAERGMSNRVLSPEMAKEMLTLQINPEIENLDGGPAMRMGLGWQLGPPSDPGRYEHDGVNIGFLAEVVMWDSGHGMVIMANNWSFETEIVMRYLANAIAEEYGWDYRVSPYTPWPYADTVVLATDRLRGPQAAIATYYDLKKLWAEQKGQHPPKIAWTSDPPDFPPNEWDLFVVANTLADSHRVKDAVELMKVEISEYPKWPNAYVGANGYAGLGELYLRAGEKQLAIQTYEKLLQFEPGDQAAIEALQKLKKKN